ncbi:MAG TPA: BCD family MFS transporter [Anaerolineales bacterium]|nr:BCD family MFS transporter [Anaerolineales bacterium]HRF48534.1 BCD family MFS transporter [Anaerolineales bacterium]
MWRKYLQLGLLHTAVALLTLPVDDNLNRVMNVELGLPLTLVTALISLPYLAAPLQVGFGAWADRHPIAGRRRTPYVAIGLALCAAGVTLLPVALLQVGGDAGIGLAVVGFLLWGVGYNISTVAYFALASELFGERLRSRAVAVMYFVMLISVIIGGIVFSRVVANVPDTVEALAGPLTNAIWGTVGVALVVGTLGLIGLEPAGLGVTPAAGPTPGPRALLGLLAANPLARRFFIYLTLLLIAILGQDVLLEPFGGQVLGMPLAETARLRSIYGVCFLIALALAALMERVLSKRRVAQAAALFGGAAFTLLMVSSLTASQPVFYSGLILLGLAIGVSTVTNHSFMLDMTAPSDTGLFIGAWGLAVSLARLLGGLVNGVVRDLVGGATRDPGLSYAAVFGLQLVFILGSLVVLAGLPRLSLSSPSPAKEALTDRVSALAE